MIRKATPKEAAEAFFQGKEVRVVGQPCWTKITDGNVEMVGSYSSVFVLFDITANYEIQEPPIAKVGDVFEFNGFKLRYVLRYIDEHSAFFSTGGPTGYPRCYSISDLKNNIEAGIARKVEGKE